jgi:hypothetical protein
MKWSDLSFKEKKQIYDSIKAQNPDTTYLDIKSQFDSIPGYEDGKDNSVAAVYSLPEVTVYPQNKFGDIARTQGYETAKNWQTVRNATTAGINEFVNDPRTQMVLAAVPMPSGIEVLSDAINIGKSASKSKQLFYHGSPVRFDKFDAQFIGSAEGGSKAMKGINLWYKSPKNAPKFANIKSPDAPIHLGRSSKPLGGELNPTVYDVVGTDLNLYKTESNRVKGLLQSNLEALKYDGIQTPSQITVFPGSVNKLKIVKKQSIPDFIKNHPEVDEWTQWTTNEELRNLVESKIPAYEDGGKKVTPPRELGLTPGTSEYYKRQQQISGKASTVQPEAYITPAGYVKDAINFVEDLSNGDYTGAAVDAALNIIPWGVGKTLKKFKSKVGRLIEGTDEYATSSYAEPFTPTITKPIKAKRTPSGERNYNPAKPPKDIEAQAAMLQDTWYREAVNKNQYSNEILRSVDQALYPDEDTRKLVREIDKAYNTNYEKAYSDIAYKEITGRKDYVSYGSMGDNIYGKANMKNIQDGFTSSNVDDYSIVLDPSTYMPGTANHELGHVADGIAGSIKYEAEPGVDYITNPYLRYLADPDNTYTTKELRDAGFHSAARNKRYLLNPTESKSHMLTLKRALKDSNKISKWSDPVDENMILDYFRSGRANGAVRNQYDLYIDKQRYIDRLNRLVPMEWLLPTIGLGGAEFLREKQNNKSN